MQWSVAFFFNSIMLGVGLAMDAFSVSMANGLSEPEMKKSKMCAVSGVFAAFQFAMPMLGWVCVHTVVEYFTALEAAIPWIAFGLLALIGGKMVLEGVKSGHREQQAKSLGVGALLLQGIATSIDALSVGFTISEYKLNMALAAGCVIGAVTFAICLAGVLIGKKFGTHLSNRAQIFGGVILIAVGAEIFIKAMI